MQNADVNVKKLTHPHMKEGLPDIVDNISKYSTDFLKHRWLPIIRVLKKFSVNVIYIQSYASNTSRFQLYLLRKAFLII